MDKYADRPKEGRHIRSAEWWQAQAFKLAGGKCLKCRGLTDGVYVPPSLETHLECAVMERCRICGWDRVAVTGRVNEAITEHPRPLTHLKPVGAPGAARRRLTSNDYKRLKAGKKPAEHKERYHD